MGKCSKNKFIKEMCVSIFNKKGLEKIEFGLEKSLNFTEPCLYEPCHIICDYFEWSDYFYSESAWR